MEYKNIKFLLRYYLISQIHHFCTRICRERAQVFVGEFNCRICESYVELVLLGGVALTCGKRRYIPPASSVTTPHISSSKRMV